MAEPCLHSNGRQPCSVCAAAREERTDSAALEALFRFAGEHGFTGMLSARAALERLQVRAEQNTDDFVSMCDSIRDVAIGTIMERHSGAYVRECGCLVNHPGPCPPRHRGTAT